MHWERTVTYKTILLNVWLSTDLYMLWEEITQGRRNANYKGIGVTIHGTHAKHLPL